MIVIVLVVVVVVVLGYLVASTLRTILSIINSNDIMQ